MTLPSNFVPLPPAGFIIIVQYWRDDEARALRLARLLADIEPVKRPDMGIALVRRFDCPASEDLQRTYYHCQAKFSVMDMATGKERGHPDGCNSLWAGAVGSAAAMWADGRSPFESAFTIEHDGVPLCVDWIDRLKLEHNRTLSDEKRVTGALMDRPGPAPHVNGSLLLHLSTWLDRPSLHQTPRGQAWDIFHHAVLVAECRPTTLIKNVYGSVDWTPGALAAMARETAWLANVKDDSAIEWAEQQLKGRQ